MIRGILGKTLLSSLLVCISYNCGGPINELTPVVEESIKKREARALLDFQPIRSNLSPYEEQLIRNGLVNIQEMDTSLKVELKYATPDNFLDSAIYGSLTTCYMRLEAAAKLALAQEELQRRKEGYSLLVYDGARPVAVQEEMWKIVEGTSQQNYVANPRVGSIHNYGCAVDLTIVNEKGEALDMGTPFDFFGKLAQPRHNKTFLRQGKLTKEQVANRELLRTVMEWAGFQGIPSEWWHFNAYGLEHVRENYVMIM